MKRIFSLLLFGLVACGYHTVRGGHASSERLAVVLMTTNVTDTVASDEVVAGIREELSASGDGDRLPAL